MQGNNIYKQTYVNPYTTNSPKNMNWLVDVHLTTFIACNS
jgi:hypothetical protein